jgi:hypothetical protein
MNNVASCPGPPDFRRPHRATVGTICSNLPKLFSSLQNVQFYVLKKEILNQDNFYIFVFNIILSISLMLIRSDLFCTGIGL